MTTYTFQGYKVRFNDDEDRAASFAPSELVVVVEDDVRGFLFDIQTTFPEDLSEGELIVGPGNYLLNGVDLATGDFAYGYGGFSFNSRTLDVVAIESDNRFFDHIFVLGDISPSKITNLQSFNAFLSQIDDVFGVPLGTNSAPFPSAGVQITENDIYRGTRGADTFDGGLGRDVLVGRNGNDSLSGGAKNDDLRGGKGKDVLNGDRGSDILDGGAQADILNGGAGGDTLLGGRGKDDLFGGGGRDVLDGGQSADRLVGGKGGDTFVFKGNIDSDVIVDFDLERDTLQLDDGLWTGDLTARQVVKTFGSAQGDAFVLDFGDGSGSKRDQITLDGLEDVGIRELASVIEIA